MTDAIDALLRRIDVEDVRQRLDRNLEPVRRLRPRGSVLLPRRQGAWVLEALLAGLSDDEREAVRGELGCEEILERVTGKGCPWEVYCECPGSPAGGSWGFASFELGPRGYFFEVPDVDEIPDNPYRLLGAWEPVASRAAYEAAWVEVYVTWWEDIGLPPIRGEVAEGPRPLMLQALERILGEDDAVWAAEIRESIDTRYLELTDLIRWTAEETGIPLGTVEAVLRGAVSGVAALAPAELRRQILREAYLETWRGDHG